jgi:hypothetical protein
VPCIGHWLPRFQLGVAKFPALPSTGFCSQSTTGPRITVRFFGGFDFSPADAQTRLDKAGMTEPQVRD